MRLDVSDNPMTEEAAPALGDMLRRHPGLQALNLSDTALGDVGVSAVVEALHASADGLQVGPSAACLSPAGLVGMAT